MFSINEEIYCDKYKKYGLLIQQYNLETQRFRDKMKMRWIKINGNY